MNNLKLVVCGSREFDDLSLLVQILDAHIIKITQAGRLEYYENIEIVEGGARGVDRMARSYATMRKYPYKTFEADWKAHGKRAGMIRNEQMWNYGDEGVAIWDGKSTGTRHSIECAFKNSNKLCKVYSVELKWCLVT